MGDILIWPGLRITLQSDEDVKAYYESVGIDLWSDWRWIDNPIRWIEDRNMPRLA